jgi:hypothetical protein
MSQVLDIQTEVDLPSIVAPEWHPMVPNLSSDEVEQICASPEGRVEYLDWFKKRAARIKQADEQDGEPYAYGWELDHWKDSDVQMKQPGVKGQYVAGGKRATKSERAAKRVVQVALTLPRAKLWCLQGSERTSISEQQGLIWKYLPNHIKALNSRQRHGWAKLSYSQDAGFASRVLVLPNRSEVHFLTYNQDPKEYQGWQLGAILTPEKRLLIRNTPWLFNLGAWADEDMPLTWLETVQLRCTTRDALWMWTFSTTEGITTTVKAVLGTPQNLATRRAELLPENQRLVPNCPPGHVPLVQRNGSTSIVYFHTDLNPFPPNYENVKAYVAGKPVATIMQDAYGYSEDSRSRAHPKFGSWNVIKPEQLPAEGTNYFFCDPAGARMWFCFWVRVGPGNPPTFYAYRDWPDEAHFGAWAQPSKDPNRWDGETGPAQRGRGYGYAQYKRAWLLAEREEKIQRRYIDSRAGRDQRTSDEGGTCPIDELAKEQTDKQGTVPVMHFTPARGFSRDAGLQAINDLLDWDMMEPLTRTVNEPHLYVVDCCQQLIWCLSNNTASDGETAACKDAEDVLRYMATEDLVHLSSEAMKTRGGGSY